MEMHRLATHTMAARALIFGFALAASEAIRRLFHFRHPTAVIHVLREIPEPRYFYINVDQKVFALKLRD
jgi:hypothetical protein